MSGVLVDDEGEGRGPVSSRASSIFLILDTPILNVTDVETWARALYRDDPDPITTERELDEMGHEQYTEERLRTLVDYLTDAELTQCAHRNRLLRHDRRTVVTLCQGEVGYLPVTETITAFPRLTDDGRLYAEEKSAQDKKKLEAAARQLEEEGIPLTVRGLADVAHLAHGTVTAWLKQRRTKYPTHVLLTLHNKSYMEDEEHSCGVQLAAGPEGMVRLKKTTRMGRDGTPSG